MSIGRVPRAAFEFVAKSARSTIRLDRASCMVGEDGFEANAYVNFLSSISKFPLTVRARFYGGILFCRV